MVEKEIFKATLNYILVLVLFISAFFIIKPVIFAIIYGIVLAYLFYPVYNFILSKIKSEIASALIICFGILVILISLMAVVFTTLVKQLINFYLTIQQINIGEAIAKSLPEFLSDSTISSTITSSINDSISKLIAGLVKELGNIIINIPNLFLQVIVFAFIFFFALKD